MPASEPSGPLRVALVEDDADFQASFAGAVAGCVDIDLAHVAATRAEALRHLDGPPVDVLLVDLGLPDGSGIDVIRAARARWPDCEVVVSTVFGDETHVLRSIEAGASGYLLKDSDPASLLDELRSVARGGSPISPLIARQILLRFRTNTVAAIDMPARAAAASAGAEVPNPPTDDARDALSGREKEVLEFITKGFTTDEIARLLQVSPHTVLTYIRRIYGKLNVKSRTEAVFEARARGILA